MVKQLVLSINIPVVLSSGEYELITDGMSEVGQPCLQTQGDSQAAVSGRWLKVFLYTFQSSHLDAELYFHSTFSQLLLLIRPLQEFKVSPQTYAYQT